MKTFSADRQKQYMTEMEQHLLHLKGVAPLSNRVDNFAKYVIALAFLHFDVYEPTKRSVELFLPRIHRGSILGFDEINNPMWPGETLALLESLNVRDLKIEKISLRT